MAFSEKRLVSFLGISAEDARAIRAAVQIAENCPMTESEPRGCGYARAYETALEEINRVFADARPDGHGAYGIEAIRGNWQNGYWGDIVCCYVNRGDTYIPTILYHRDRGFILSSWGDYVERCSRVDGIE